MGRYVEATRHLCRVEAAFYGRPVICLAPAGECKKHFRKRTKGSSVRETGLYQKPCVGKALFALPGSRTTADAIDAARSRHYAHEDALVQMMVGVGTLGSIGSLEGPAPAPTRQHLALPTELAPNGFPVLSPSWTPQSSLAWVVMLLLSTPLDLVGTDLEETSLAPPQPNAPGSSAHETSNAPRIFL